MHPWHRHDGRSLSLSHTMACAIVRAVLLYCTWAECSATVQTAHKAGPQEFRLPSDLTARPSHVHLW
jgi:hypothetical protein